MIWPGSLQARLALGLGVTLTVLWLAATVWTAADLRQETDEIFDAALQETAQRLLPLAVTEIINRDPADGSQTLARISDHDEFFAYIVRDGDGNILMRSHGADQTLFPGTDSYGFTSTDTHRFYSEPALQGAIWLTASEPLSERRGVARDLTKRLGLPLLLVLPLTLIIVIVVVQVGLGSLRRFGSGLTGRGARDLSPVPTTDLPSDLRPLADTVNDLLSRLSEAFEAERGFAANAAHELRTPLAGAIAQAQRLRSETTDSAAAERATAIETTLKRLTRTSERLMQLARAEGGRLRVDAPGDLRPVLQVITEEIARTVAHGRLDLDLADAPVMSDLDPDALAIIARNLIDNALRHGAPDQPVKIVLRPAGELIVSNDGPPVPRDVLAKMANRFTRHGTAEGSGLGLAIVASIAERTGGSLTLRSPRQGSKTGFEAIVSVSGGLVA